MTGHQEHPGTGRRLDHEPTNRIVFEDMAKSMACAVSMLWRPMPVRRILRRSSSRARQRRTRSHHCPTSLHIDRQTASGIREVRNTRRMRVSGVEASRVTAIHRDLEQDYHVEEVTNIVIAGLGGQGVLKSSDILAQAVLAAGFDVKKSELHGMSQRGGSVSSDVRFGKEVLSPMVPWGEADYAAGAVNRPSRAEPPLPARGGVLITPEQIDTAAFSIKRASTSPCSAA